MLLHHQIYPTCNTTNRNQSGLITDHYMYFDRQTRKTLKRHYVVKLELARDATKREELFSFHWQRLCGSVVSRHAKLYTVQKYGFISEAAAAAQNSLNVIAAISYHFS